LLFVIFILLDRGRASVPTRSSCEANFALCMVFKPIVLRMNSAGSMINL
jgi:hypothetical protein